jgi:hypothetical protein
VGSLLDCMVYVLLVGSFYLSATANAKTNLFVRVCRTAHYAASGLMAKPIGTTNAQPFSCDLRRVVLSQSAVCRLFVQVDFRRKFEAMHRHTTAHQFQRRQLLLAQVSFDERVVIHLRRRLWQEEHEPPPVKDHWPSFRIDVAIVILH